MFKEEISNAVMGQVYSIMKFQGYTQTQLAAKAGMSRGYLSQMMNGKRPINQWVINCLQKALNIRIEVEVKAEVKTL